MQPDHIGGGIALSGASDPQRIREIFARFLGSRRSTFWRVVFENGVDPRKSRRTALKILNVRRVKKSILESNGGSARGGRGSLEDVLPRVEEPLQPNRIATAPQRVVRQPQVGKFLEDREELNVQSRQPVRLQPQVAQRCGDRMEGSGFEARQGTIVQVETDCGQTLERVTVCSY